MSIISAGSVWAKWDLHVHTPDSFFHRYPGSHDDAWEAFLRDLEALPREFKVIGINDYVLVDGYERVLRAKREQGRLSNIDLILPVIELRLDKFGGTVQAGKNGASWSRINLHVIFDQVEAEFIRQQFISAIAPHYRLLAGSTHAGDWHQVITRASVEKLGRAILDSVPSDKRGEYGSALIEGFNSLNVSADGVHKALENDALRGKCIVAVGKTEWEDLKWNDHTIAEKKSLINCAQLVFTASATPEQYDKGRAKLRANGVNDHLLDCSDAHSLSTSIDKDRIGNCFTWVKADCTFDGLMQACQEFDARVFIGNNPPKRKLVDDNKTKFIKSVHISKKQGSPLVDPWFDVELPLSSDLVAVIGNKGSGKSALSDAIALAGCTRNFAKFSFLTQNRFRSVKSRYASQFTATLTWHDGSTLSADLDKNPPISSVERVKYLPQSYLEDLCNELGDRGSESFDSELRKIIYSHVPNEDRLGRSSMDELLSFKVSEIEKARTALKVKISRLNTQILDVERRIRPEFRDALGEQLATKKAELAALDAAKPLVVEDPSLSPQALADSKVAAGQIEALQRQLESIDGEAAAKRNEKAAAMRTEAVARKILQVLETFRGQYETFAAEVKSLATELGEAVRIDDLLRVDISASPLDALIAKAQARIKDIDDWLRSDAPGSFRRRRADGVSALDNAKEKLGERQRQFVRYKEDLRAWEQGKAAIAGGKDRPGTIGWLTAEIASLSNLPRKLQELRVARNAITRDIHSQIHAMVDEYKRLYGPVQAFVASAQELEMKIPLEFHARIEAVGFEDQFLGRLNRQVRGSFAGIDESTDRTRGLLDDTDFDASDEVVGFTNRVDQMLRADFRDGQGGRETQLADQLRKGVEPSDILDYLFGLEYLKPRYSLTYAGQEIGQLSPGERGLLLLVFYLLVDKDDIPIVIDQPEENLDNQTIYKVLVKCIKRAKERRQVIMVTHNPNLAVVCDAEQIVCANCDKAAHKFEYEAGAIECPKIKDRVVEILEGTEPAFKNRQVKYRLL